jgi:hypothetical protein
MTQASKSAVAWAASLVRLPDSGGMNQQVPVEPIDGEKSHYDHRLLKTSSRWSNE